MKMNRWLQPDFWYKSIEKSQYDFSEMYPMVTGVGILVILISFTLPINGYLLVVIGLIFDIVGAIFVIEPVVTQFRNYEKLSFFKKSLLSSKTIDKLEENHIKQSQKKGMLGLRILILGFILQIIGNYFQYLNSLS